MNTANRNTVLVTVVMAIGAMLLMSTAARAQVYPEGIVAYWKFDNETATDAVGDHDGTIVGPGAVWVSDGKVGGALHLDGSAWVEVPAWSASPDRPSDQLTIEAWVRVDSMPYWNSGVVGLDYYGDGTYANPWTAYGLGVGWAQLYASFGMANQPSGTTIIVFGPPLTDPDAWYHLVGTYDGQNSTGYVNGVFQGQTGRTGPLDYGNSTDLSIGAMSPFSVGWPNGRETLVGTLDEVAVYDRALTAEEILQHYENGLIGLGYELGPAPSDSDHDGVPDDLDVCPGGDDNVDTDEDGVPDFCDPCPIDLENDSDGDGVCDSEDLCLGDDTTGDSDTDGVCDDQDPCVGSPNVDGDGDGICDNLDGCVGDDATGDLDGDGFCDDVDLCLGNDASGDTDEDGTCDDIDVCFLDPENDADGDGVCESNDNCPEEWNPSQKDTDEDGPGDECDPDLDGDNVPNERDNCLFDFNPGQEDFDLDGAGDFCDADDDEDGVQDDGDECPLTAPGAVIAENGCSIAQLCPCENDWKNHGAYVRCVAHTSEVFVDLGLITEEEKGAIVSEAAQSSCGHKNR